MKRPKEKDLDLGRFRLEVYAAGTCDLRGRGFFSAEDHAVYRAAHFPSAEAAVAAFLDDLWDWTADPDIPEPERIPETLLANTAVVVDRRGIARRPWSRFAGRSLGSRACRWR